MKKLNPIICVLILLVSLCIWIDAENTNQETKDICEANEYFIRNTLEQTELALASVNEQLDLLDVIYQEAERYDLPPELALAIMRVESNFNPNAENGKCKGLMQVSTIHTTADLLDLRTNVKISFSILDDLKAERDDLHEVLGCYNRGEYGYSEYVKETNQKATAYSNKVINLMNELKGEN